MIKLNVKHFIDLLEKLNSEKKIVFISIGPDSNTVTELDKIDLVEDSDFYKILVDG